MSSITQCRSAVHLLIIFVCVLICQGGFLDFRKLKHEGDEEYEGGALLQKAQAMIEFPELDEMNSAERVANRQRARKVATIIEKSIHMMANDILQMWAIARTDKDDGEDADVETEGEGEAEERGGESNTGPELEASEGVEAVEGANAKANEGTGVNSSSAAVANAAEGAAPQQSSEGLDANKIEGEGAKTSKEVGAESTKGAGDKTTEGVGVKLTKVVEAKSTKGLEEKSTKGEEAKSAEGVEGKSTERVEAMSTEGAQSKTAKVPRNNNSESKEGSLVTQEGVRKSEVAQNTNDLKKTQIMRSKGKQHGKYIISDEKNGRTLLQLSEMLVK